MYVSYSLILFDVGSDSMNVSNIYFPFYQRDPFDRMLVVQSINNNLKILSRDKILDSYTVSRIW